MDKMRKKITVLTRKKQGSICQPPIRLSAGTGDSVRDAWLNCFLVSGLLEYLCSSLLIILLSAKFAHMAGFPPPPPSLFKCLNSFYHFHVFPSICWHPSGICFCFVSEFYLLLEKHKLLSSVDLPCCYVRRA